MRSHVTPLFALTENMESIAHLYDWDEHECCYQRALRNGLILRIKSELFCEVLHHEMKMISRHLKLYREQIREKVINCPRCGFPGPDNKTCEVCRGAMQ